MRLNLGAIAKSYAIDKAIDILKEEKIKNALINAGGDLKSIEKNQTTELENQTSAPEKFRVPADLFLYFGESRCY
jgi:thiamine biosynthesis lipoprotein